MTNNTKQLSRVAGAPRLKLPIWKAAAPQFFTGKDPSRDEQRNQNRKTKVALLRELAASDPSVRSWVIKFTTDLRARDARQIAADQGLTMPERLGFVSLFPGDRPDLTLLARTVICMEKPNATELLEKLTTLYPDGDLPEVVERQANEWAEFEAEMEERQDPSKIKHGCNTGGFNNGPATRVIEIGGKAAHFCDKHDGKRPFTPGQPEPTGSPAEYVNSDFGKSDPCEIRPGDDPRTVYLKTIRRATLDAQALPARRGATPEGAIVVSVYGPPNEK